MDKKHAYEQRIREVEHASFTPQLLVVWLKKPQIFIKDWLHILLINWTNHITTL